MDDEQAELVKRGKQLCVDISGKADELYAVLHAISQADSRQPKVQDKYGEPTWSYLVKVAIPDKIHLTRAFREFAVENGFREDKVSELWNGSPTSEGFVRYYQRTGTKWKNWTKVWQNWVTNENKRRAGPRESRFDRVVGKTRG